MSKERYYTLPQVAKRLGHHRTTLLRMEQRGVIPKATWALKPIRARVYTEADIKIVEAALTEYFSHKPGGGEGLLLSATDIVKPGEE